MNNNLPGENATKMCDAAPTTAAGFWRRTAAFAIDSLLLGLAGMLVIALAFDWLVGIGAWGRLIGFAIGSLYFVLFEGIRHPGQSPGKRALKIKVVKTTPEGFVTLSPTQVWIRYAILAVPFVLGGLTFVDIPPLRDPGSWFAHVNSIIAFLWGAAIVYLLVFNGPSRCSLHDLATGATVVRVDALACSQTPVRRLHWIVIAITAVLLATGSLASRQWFIGKLATQSAIQQAVAAVPGVRQSGVTELHQINQMAVLPHTVITAFVATSGQQTHQSSLAIVHAAFAAAPGLAGQSQVTVIMVRSAELGIATWRTQIVDSRSGSDWVRQMN